MEIHIKTIPHDEHRYSTVGDYWVGPDGAIEIRVSDMGDTRYELLVALHELIEKALCDARGISNDSIDEFDKAYEAARTEDDDSEPGDASDAPYRKEHFFATTVERLMCAELGVDWAVYDATVLGMP